MTCATTTSASTAIASCSSTGTWPAAGTPTVEFAWYLAQDAWRIDATHDEIEADHRAAQGDALSD